MKKLLALLLTLSLLFTLFAGCKKKENADSDSSDDTAYTDNDNIDDFDDGDDSDETDDYDDLDDFDDYDDDDSDETDDYEDETDENNNSSNNNSNTSSTKPTTDNKSNLPNFDNSAESSDSGLSQAAQRAENIKAGEDEAFNKLGYIYDGNQARLANAIRKSQKGQKVKIVSFGGVNTATNAVEENLPYSNYTSVLNTWWNENVGNAEVVSAGGDALTSITASLMLEEKLLSENPDVVILDFSVQDAFNNSARANSVAFDNIIRRIYKANSNTAIIILTMSGATQYSYTNTASNTEEITTTFNYQLEIAKYYQIPVIDFGGAFNTVSTSLVEVTTKKEYPVIIWNDISRTNIALNDDGHKMLASMITGYFSNALKNLSKLTSVGNAIPTVGYFADDTYMNCSYVNVYQMAKENSNHVSGYSYDYTLAQLEDYNYRAGDSTESFIRTYRHYVPVDPTDTVQQEVSTGTPYLTINIPEESVTTKRYFVIGLSSNINLPSSYIPKVITHYPVTIISYDKDGNRLASIQATRGVNSEAKATYGYQILSIPSNAAKLEIQAYCYGGTIHLYGIGCIK